ncbi:hypothetical protein [Rhizobium leguminosarum]|uniref:hypothetical protein n=1 Tax=Rhizobium leguminosarum TaxID=384 RepID=UPI001AE5BC2E|nr:hypothetical protein [Rhizobium leguminosarum]
MIVAASIAARMEAIRPWTSSDAGWWPGVLPMTTFWMNWRTILMKGCFVSVSACSRM